MGLSNPPMTKEQIIEDCRVTMKSVKFTDNFQSIEDMVAGKKTDKVELLETAWEIIEPSLTKQISEWLSVALTSLQESTEKRVREEFRAAVEKLKKKEDPYDSRGDIYWVEYSRALSDIEALLQDPKK